MMFRIIFLLIVSTHALLGQNAGEYFFVRDSLAFIMSKPDTGSEAIRSVRQGDLLYIVERTAFEKDNTDGQSFWYHVTFEKSEGYIAGTHCSNVSVRFNSIDTFDILYGQYAELDYNPDLYWYAVISTVQGDLIKKVTIKPTLDMHADGHDGILPIKRDSNNLLFLIGTNEILETTLVGVQSFLPEIWLKPRTAIDLILYDKVKGFSTGHKLTPDWRYLKSKIAARDSFTDYRLSYFNPRHQLGVVLYKPEGSDFNQIPTLIWHGDVDHDQLPEFLFFTNSDNRGSDIEFIRVVYKDGVMKALKLVSKRPGWPPSC